MESLAAFFSSPLELIPERHTEVIFSAPPFLSHGAARSRDGFGDVSFRLKERIFARNEEHGNAIVTAFLGASIPTGKNGSGSCCAVVTPTLIARDLLHALATLPLKPSRSALLPP
jgi:hypothetical protein